LRRLKRERWLLLLCGRTLKPSASPHFEAQWNAAFCRPGSPANHSARTAAGGEQKTPGTFGPTSPPASPLANPGGSSSRTSRESSAAGAATRPGSRMEPRYCSMSLASWNAEVTAARGEYSARLSAGQRNDASESIYWPTPTVAEAQKIPNCANYGQVALSNHPAIVGVASRQPHVKTYRDGVGPIGLINPNTSGNARALNPDWVEQLMGLPVKWTDFDCAAMESSPPPQP